MRQMARNLTAAFEAILKERGVKCAKIPAQSPNCNPHAERFVRTIKSECLNHLVLFGERYLRYVVKKFIAHYHRERFHQGIGEQLIEKQASSATDKRTSGKVVYRSRLGEILNFCYREAA
jgi:transposase InsO family protein